MQAYLVIREGSKWTDLFRLAPGIAVTIGRAPTNPIVIKDERCSRTHAEVFPSGEDWVLRDLDSRNGTFVGAQQIRADYTLCPGDIIRIGRSQLAFVDNLNTAFADFDPPVPSTRQTDGASVSADSNSQLDDVMLSGEAPTITHRRGQTRFLAPGRETDVAGSRMGRAASHLCRLAFELAKGAHAQQLAEIAINGLLEATPLDTAGVLLFPKGLNRPTQEADLEVVSSRAPEGKKYHRLSMFLAATVLRDGEAVLARNILGDSQLGSRDSKGEIHTTNVICAPIRRGAQLFGLIHLYSNEGTRVPDPEDLEFTLAVSDTLAVAVDNLYRRDELAANLTRVRDENLQLRERLGVQSEIVGSSAVVHRIMEDIGRAAPSRATVLIRGESGVGKELVARAVHYSSPRAKNVFVCLNCAALSESLLESELFGHERGAFTGATDRKIGKFEMAHKGTLLLDEIGEMSPTIQAKFLRVLEGHPFERVGGSEPVKVDVRCIAATNRDLEKDVAENRFRRDLYFRLAVLEVFVPALRKRPEDIPVLVQHFLEKFNKETGRKIRGVAPRALEQLIKYRWPGNIRELKNVVERAVLLCRGEYIEAEDVMVSRIATAGDTNDSAPLMKGYEPMTLDDMERLHIMATLRATGWNKSKTAEILGIERSTLDRKIRRYELHVDERSKAV